MQTFSDHSFPDKSLNAPCDSPVPFRLYTLDQVTEMTGWSLSHLRRAIRAGKLIYHQLGRSIRISQADLEAFVATSRSMNDAAKKRAKSMASNSIRKRPG